MRYAILTLTLGTLCLLGHGFVPPTPVRRSSIIKLAASNEDQHSYTESKLSRRGVVDKAMWAQAALLGGLTLGLKGGEAGAAEEAKAPAKKKVKVKTTENGVKYVDIVVGEGGTPQPGDFVIINYSGFLSNGQAFDTLHMKGKKNFAFRLGSNQVIPGLEEAIKTMKPGGERQLLIPPALGYGSKGVCLEDSKECLVPPNETLKYDVVLKRVALSPLP